MNNEMIVAKRYARALFEAAQEQDRVSEVEKSLELLVQYMESHDDLARFLEHPNLKAEAKLDLLKQIVDPLPALLFNTLRLLFERGREAVLPDLHNAFVKAANEARGREVAVVYSPFALSEEDMAAVSKKFSELTGKQIEVKSEIDPGLLGGLKVRIGDRLYDGSLAGKLERLEKQLNASQAM